MKLLHQNPPPPLLTGHSPPKQPVRTPAAQAGQPRFGSLVALTPNSVSQFITDTLGVWAPKVPITRSKTQFFEDAFLELVEDGAFYFTLPVVGPLLGMGIAKLSTGVRDWKNDDNLKKLAEHLDLKDKGQVDARKLVGHPMRKISEALDKMALDNSAKQDILQKVVRTKAGALIGTIGVAAGFEYMIQHTKNVITAKGFKTKNFAAVAGLEEGKAHTPQGLTDPVEKAKKRGKQVGYLTLASLAAAFAAPRLLKNFGLQKAEEIMKVVDCKPGFDISKPILAMLIGTGVASYLDAARDPLEKKETGTRLCVVVPYLLFGKELAGYGITKFKERFTKVVVGQDNKGKDVKLPLKEIQPLTNGVNPLKQMLDKKNLLDFDVVKKGSDIVDGFKDKNTLKIKEKLEKLGRDKTEGKLGFELTDEIKAKVIAEHGKLNMYSYLFGALCAGLGMNWLIYKQTQARYTRQQETAKAQQATAGFAATRATTPTPFQPPLAASAAFSGRQQAGSPWNVPAKQPVQWPAPAVAAQLFTPFSPSANRIIPQQAQG